MRITRRNLLIIFLMITLLLACSPMSLSASFAASKTPQKEADIHITHLKAYTRVAQLGLQKNQVRLGYRNVWLSWDTRGIKLGVTYRVYVKKTSEEKYKLATTVNGKMARLILRKTASYDIKVVGVKNKVKGKDSLVLTVRPGIDAPNATKVYFTKAPTKVAVGETVYAAAQSNSGVSSKISWSSSKSSIAKVSNGAITGVKEGNTYINAIAHNGVRERIAIKVIPRYPKTVTIAGATSRKLEKKETLLLTAKTSEAGFSTVTWSTSDKTVATVAKDGKVTAKGPGTVTITCTAIGGASASVNLSVAGNIDSMIAWAKKIAADNSYGYSMGTSISKGRADRYCHSCNGSASKDYDCASFVAACVAHGYGDTSLLSYCKWSGGCTTLKNTLLKHGWENVGKLPVSKLKPGDILINPSRHVELYVGNGQNAGAHDNYDGKPGDKSGREINIQGTWNFYTMVLRHK